jgi:hypothetical protein
MNRPSIIVRAAGSPVAAIPLTLGGVWLVFMWTQGHASLWLALMGFVLAVRTISSVRQCRRYKAWRKQWESVGTFGKEPARRPKNLLRRATILASVLFIGTIACLPQVADNPPLQTILISVCFLCSIFLIARVVIGIVRRGFNPPAQERGDSKTRCRARVLDAKQNR